LSIFQTLARERERERKGEREREREGEVVSMINTNLRQWKLSGETQNPTASEHKQRRDCCSWSAFY
jgi:hypothetical protein